MNSNSNNSPMLKAAGLWQKTSVKGGQYLTGRLGGLKVLIMENRDRKTDDDPSHTLFVAALGRDVAAVQPVSDLAQRRAVRLHRQDRGKQVGRPLVRLGRLGGLRIHRRSSCRTGREGTDGPNYHEFQIARPCPDYTADMFKAFLS